MTAHRKEMCTKCGRSKGNHKAQTYHCPVGMKHRAMGYISFSNVERFQLKTGKENEKPSR